MVASTKHHKLFFQTFKKDYISFAGGDCGIDLVRIFMRSEGFGASGVVVSS